MITENNKATAETQIQQLIEERVKAIRDRDINALLSNHVPDVRSFDLLAPLHYTGADTVRERTQKWLSSYQGSISYKIRDLEITAGDDVAFCHYIYHVTGTLTGGGNVDMWARATVCLREIDGKWMIAHEHQSVPFDVETGKASLDLKPQDL